MEIVQGGKMRVRDRKLSSRELMRRLKNTSWAILAIESNEWNYYSEVQMSILEENWWEDEEKYYIQFAKNVYENIYEKHSGYEDKGSFSFLKSWNWIQKKNEDGRTVFFTDQKGMKFSLILLEEQRELMEPVFMFGYPEVKRKFMNSKKVNIVVKSAIYQQVSTWRVQKVEEEETSICVTGRGENLFRVNKEWNWIKEKRWGDFEEGNMECIRTNINSNMGKTEIICTFYY